MAVEIENGYGQTKLYEQVHERLARFREDCPASAGWGIVTDILNSDGSKVVISAKIIDPKGTVVATGHAEEDRNYSDVNRTSATENGETSAVGRALFLAGYGNGEVCSAEELLAAINAQSRLKGKAKNAAPSTGAQTNQRTQPKRSPAAKTSNAKASPGKTQGGNAAQHIDPKVLKVMASIGLEPFAGFSLTYAYDGERVMVGGDDTKKVRVKLKALKFEWDGKVWWKKIK